MRYLKQTLRDLLPQLLTCNCLVCDQVSTQSNGLCTECTDELPWQPPGCQRCGITLDEITNNFFLCYRCNASPPSFDRCSTLFSYEGPVPDMIQRFKDKASFSDYQCLSKLFGQLFCQHCTDEPWLTPDFLVPVPLHNRRLRQRGFNQSVMLARHLSRLTGIPVLLQACKRLANQHAQRGLSARQRLDNTQHMFVPGRHASRVSGHHLAIIDDVVTTTATSQAMSTVLKNCGAATVHVWALARVNL